jgi:hypothetical protein
MGNCKYIHEESNEPGKECSLYHFRGLDYVALTPEYKERICHTETHRECFVWRLLLDKKIVKRVK